MCDNYCKDCRFRGGGRFTEPQYWSCDYIGYKNTPRGCPSGIGCTKKEIGKPREKHPESWIGITDAKKKRLDPKEKTGKKAKPEREAPKKRVRKKTERRPELEELAAEVRAFRQELGLSQSKFAELLGVSSNSIYNWESARYKPDLGLLRSASMVIPKDANGI